MPINFVNFPGIALPILQRIDQNVQALLATAATLQNQETIINDLNEILTWASPPVATGVEICVTSYSPLKGGPTVAGAISLNDDHIAHTPIKWTDDVGPVSPPADATVVSSDPAVATMAFSADMKDVDTTPVADGTCTMTVSSASLSLTDTATVHVHLPTATAVSVDAVDTTFTPKP